MFLFLISQQSNPFLLFIVDAAYNLKKNVWFLDE